MRKFIFSILLFIVSNSSHSYDITANRGRIMDCSKKLEVSEGNIIGSWYFNLGGESQWKMELKIDGKVSNAVFLNRKHTESDAIGGSWSFLDGAIELVWADGTRRKEKIIFLTDCEMETDSNGHKSYYYRKPLS